jgi:hypothetical protein
MLYYNYIESLLLEKVFNLKADIYNNILVILLTIIPSLMMLGFSGDSMRFLGYWYCLILSVLLLEGVKKYE